MMLTVILGSTVGTDGCFFCETPERGGVVTHLIAPPRMDAAPRVIILCAAHHNALRAELQRFGERREI